MNRSYFLITIAGLISIGASGCGSDGSQGPQDVIPDNGMSAYQHASCQYQFEDGGSADYALAATPDLVTTYFGKKFDFAPVHAVESASARATVDLFRTQNVKIHQVPKSVSNCHIFSSLDVAPSDYQSEWDSASGGDTNGGTIVGLYIEKGNSAVSSSSASAEIGIREDANRWVVVHEFMHHQFETYATSHGRSPTLLKKDLSEKAQILKSAAKAYQNQQTRENLTALSRAMLSVMPDIRELVTRYPLEEVTIETYLQKQFKAGAFQFMPFLEDSSNWYIASSAKKAQKMLGQFDDLLSSLANESARQGLEEFMSLQQESNANSRLEGDIAVALMETGASSVSVSDSLAYSDRVSAPLSQSPAAHCAHEREIEAVMQRLNQVSADVGNSL